jgi:hypothetical protein
MEIGDPKNNLNVIGAPVIDYQDEPFTFEKVTKPEVWRTFNSLEDMLEACQLPNELLPVISTENLIQTIMNHPLYGIYSAYNNELDGVNVLLDNFNGFKELQNREGASEAVIEYYAATDVNKMVEAAKQPGKSKDLTIYHLDYLELIIATNKIPEIFSLKSLDRLEGVLNEKYDTKLNYPGEVGLFSIRKSLLLGAEIELVKNYVSMEDRKMLQEFVNSGGRVPDDSLYSKVSEIINLK